MQTPTPIDVLPAGGHDRDDALDGLRAIAIGAVVALHISSALMPGGWAGVDLFFVLSGFLITGIVTREIDRTGGFDLRRFYIRRAVRIWPAFFLMLLVATILSPLTPNPETMASAVLSAETFTLNWRAALGLGSMWVIGHCWSLAVEQQFYLLWPVFLLLVPRRSRVAGTVTLMAAIVAWRCWLAAHGATSDRIYFGTDTRGDALLAGALVSMLEHRLGRGPVGGWRIVLLAVLGIVLLEGAEIGDPVSMALWMPVAWLVSSLLLILARRPGPLRAALGWRPVVFIGRLSYSIYLWHLPIMAVTGQFMVHGRSPVSMTITLMVAWLSFRHVELPLMRGRGRQSDAPAVAAGGPVSTG